MTEKRWSFSGGVIVGTDICEKGIPHTNRSIVTHLNRYERKIKELEEENEQLKKFKNNVQEVLQNEYDKYSDKVWSTWIKNLSHKLRVNLNGVSDEL